MSSVLTQFLQIAGSLTVVALALGVVFDWVARSVMRDLAVGAVSGAAAAGAMFDTLQPGDSLPPDTHAPLLMVGALFGGPWGALVAFSLPVATRLFIGGPSVTASIASALVAVALGLVVHAAARAKGIAFNRGMMLALAALSPLAALPLLALHVAPDAGLPQPSIAPFLLVLPFATAVASLTAFAELARSDRGLDRRDAERFQRSTDHVSREFFDRQLNHYGHMNVRFGTHSGYLLVSVDAGGQVRRALGERSWSRLRTELAQVVRASVRDSDVCAAMDFDRFAVLLPHTGETGMRFVAERIQRNVTSTFRRTGAGAVTVSLGMASFGPGLDADDVASAAETALFVANARSPRNAIGPLPPPRGSAVIHSFPAAPITRPAPVDDLLPRSNVAFFPVLIGADPDSAAQA